MGRNGEEKRVMKWQRKSGGKRKQVREERERKGVK